MTTLAILALAPFAIVGLFVPSIVRLALSDARQRRTSRNQPAPLTDGGCAIRGGVKVGRTHIEDCS